MDTKPENRIQIPAPGHKPGECFSCPSCQTRLGVQERALNKRFRCPQCDFPLISPQSAPAVEQIAPSSLKRRRTGILGVVVLLMVVCTVVAFYLFGDRKQEPIG